MFGSLNKRLVEHADPLTVTALELGAGTLALTAAGAADAADPVPGASPATCWCCPARATPRCCSALSLACTLLPFALSLVALRHMSAFAAQLAVNLEPVYAIVLAILLLGEQRELTPLFYAGVAIILAAVFAPPAAGQARGGCSTRKCSAPPRPRAPPNSSRADIAHARVFVAG